MTEEELVRLGWAESLEAYALLAARTACIAHLINISENNPCQILLLDSHIIAVQIALYSMAMIFSIFHK